MIIIWGIDFWKKFIDKNKKRTPLTQDLLRAPGQSLLSQINDIQTDIAAYMAAFVAMPSVFFSYYLLQLYRGTPGARFGAVLYVVTGIGFIVFAVYKIIQKIKLKRLYQLGFEAETAIGQELNLLMRHGFYVFHDFPAKDFNIDHVLVGPQGIFAVETKGRAKPVSAKGKKESLLEYDGSVLKFPGWQETEPVEQAERQALWLQQWLTSAVGQNVTVQPMLAIPGWFIDSTGFKKVPAINGKNSIPFFTSPRWKTIPDQLCSGPRAAARPPSCG